MTRIVTTHSAAVDAGGGTKAGRPTLAEDPAQRGGGESENDTGTHAVHCWFKLIPRYIRTDLSTLHDPPQMLGTTNRRTSTVICVGLDMWLVCM